MSFRNTTLHPLHKPIRKCASRETKRHKSTLHDLIQAFNIKPNSLETLPTTGGNPATRHKRPFKLTVASDKKASVAADEEGRENIKVYSDGSAQDGKVGAAAVLIQQGKETRTLHYHLGTTEHHTVFEAELVGLLLGLHLIKTEKTRTSYALGADNQAALTAVATPETRSGHYLAEIFLSTAFNLRKRNGTANYSLRLGWTAGHVNIEGNKLADEEAKKAAEGKTTEKSMLPKALKKPLKHSKSAAKQEHKSKLKNAWRTNWHKSPRAHRTKHIDPTIPSLKFLKLTSAPDISRQGASWLFQLRVGHIPLNEYLYRFKRMAHPNCPACGQEIESTQHFVLDCPKYAYERWTLLAGKSQKNREFANLIGQEDNALSLTAYIQATGRFRADRTMGERGVGGPSGSGREALGGR